MLVHFKKAFPLTSLGTHLKEELTAYCLLLYFESLSRQRMMNTLLMININPICKIRDSLEDKSMNCLRSIGTIAITTEIG